MATKAKHSILQGHRKGSHNSGEVDGVVAQTTEVDSYVAETTCEEITTFTAHKEETQTAVLAEEFEKRLGNEVKQFVEELKQLENEQNRAIQSVEERMKKAIEDKDKEIECLEYKTSDYRNDIKGLKVQCTILEEKYCAQTKYVEDVVMKRMAISEVNDILTSQKAELQREVYNLKEVVGRLKKTADEKESDILNYLNVIDKKNEEIKRAIESEQLMEKKLKTLQTDFEEKDREVKSIQKTNQSLNENMKNIEEKNRTQTGFIEDTVKKHMSLANENRQLESQISNLQRTIDDLRDIEKRLHTDIEKQCKTINAHRNELENLNSKLKRNKEEYDATVKKHKNDIKVQKDKFKRNKEEYDTAIKKYKDEIRAEKDKLKREKDEHEKIKKAHQDFIRTENDKAIESKQLIVKELKTLQRDFEEKERELKSIQKNNTALDEKLRQTEFQLIQEKAEHEKTKRNHNDVLKVEKDKANKEKEKLRNHIIRQCQAELARQDRKLNRAYENATFEISRLESQLHQQHKDNSELEAEKEELLLRLSKIDGAKLTYNNPNIAGFGGEKRPTQLAEDYSELYDNEWTDAFEMVDGNDDEQKIGVLYDILKHANEYFGSLSRRHDESIERSFTTLEYARRLPDRDLTYAAIHIITKTVTSDGQAEHDGKPTFGKDGSSKTGEPNSENEDGEQTDFYEQSDDKPTKPKDRGSDKKNDSVSETIRYEYISKLDFKMDMFTTEQRKTIMDMKKTCEYMQTQDVIETGTKIIADEMNIKPELNEVMKYISKCIEVCWSMYRHVPPVHINFPTDLAGTCLDKNVYRPYTKSGKHIKFVVWPAVYLHEGGILLGKGVAQGRD